MNEADLRAQRLAEALRANLKRRKAQARGETTADASPAVPPSTAPPPAITER